MITPVVHRSLLAVLLFGVAGTGLELVLTEHYEDTVQLVPLTAIAIAVPVAVWHGVKPDGVSRRALQAAMLALLVTGLAGIWFHFLGGSEFQLEIDPSQSRWDVLRKVVRAKAPPVLAPGVMVQLGLLGLVYAYPRPGVNTDVRS
jgi:hypothetical protein